MTVVCRFVLGAPYQEAHRGIFSAIDFKSYKPPYFLQGFLVFFSSWYYITLALVFIYKIDVKF